MSETRSPKPKGEIRSPKSTGEGRQRCVFCEQSNGSEEIYGKLMSKGGVTAHYFCMLFSSGLSQNGKSDKQGILGFLQEDISKEVKRAARLRCSYCRSTGATIGCVVSKCKKMFHLGCGRSNNSLHEFFGTFSSFCSSHRRQQDVPADNDPSIVCSICMNSVVAAPSNQTIRAPCCRKYWYHRDCVQCYASSAGLYFFKCPLCNNKEDFQNEMLLMGIYIPDQDASWEKEPHAFQELLERYGHCDAPVCKCAEGRKYDKEGSKWEIILCDFCGSHGSHVACNHLQKLGKHDICKDCKEVDERTREEEWLHSPPQKRKSLEQLQLELSNSPEMSKGPSPYPGPSDAMVKKGLPIPQPDFPLQTPTSKTKKKREGSPEASYSPKEKKPRRNSRASATVTSARLAKQSLVSPNSSFSDESSDDDLTLNMLRNKQIELESAWDVKRRKKEELKKKQELRKLRNESGGTVKNVQHTTVQEGAPPSAKRKENRPVPDMPTTSETSRNHKQPPQTCMSLEKNVFGRLLPADESKKKKKQKKRSFETDKNQTTLTNWLKQGSKDLKERGESKSPKTSPAKPAEQPERRKGMLTKEIKSLDMVTKTPTKLRTKRPIVIEWRGKQFLIRSPRVMLKGNGKKKQGLLRPKNLEIDMTGRRSIDWNTDLDLLSNIETRVTRNMIEVESIKKRQDSSVPVDSATKPKKQQVAVESRRTEIVGDFSNNALSSRGEKIASEKDAPVIEADTKAEAKTQTRIFTSNNAFEGMKSDNADSEKGTTDIGKTASKAGKTHSAVEHNRKRKSGVFNIIVRDLTNLNEQENKELKEKEGSETDHNKSNEVDSVTCLKGNLKKRLHNKDDKTNSETFVKECLIKQLLSKDVETNSSANESIKKIHHDKAGEQNTSVKERWKPVIQFRNSPQRIEKHENDADIELDSPSKNLRARQKKDNEVTVFEENALTKTQNFMIVVTSKDNGDDLQAENQHTPTGKGKNNFKFAGLQVKSHSEGKSIPKDSPQSPSSNTKLSHSWGSLKLKAISNQYLEDVSKNNNARVNKTDDVTSTVSTSIPVIPTANCTKDSPAKNLRKRLQKNTNDTSSDADAGSGSEKCGRVDSETDNSVKSDQLERLKKYRPKFLSQYVVVDSTNTSDNKDENGLKEDLSACRNITPDKIIMGTQKTVYWHLEGTKQIFSPSVPADNMPSRTVNCENTCPKLSTLIHMTAGIVGDSPRRATLRTRSLNMSENVTEKLNGLRSQLPETISELNKSEEMCNTVTSNPSSSPFTQLPKMKICPRSENIESYSTSRISLLNGNVVVTPSPENHTCQTVSSRSADLAIKTSTSPSKTRTSPRKLGTGTQPGPPCDRSIMAEYYGAENQKVYLVCSDDDDDIVELLMTSQT